jgi:hypothetical protein
MAKVVSTATTGNTTNDRSNSSRHSGYTTNISCCPAPDRSTD